MFENRFTIRDRSGLWQHLLLQQMVTSLAIDGYNKQNKEPR